jgi:CHAD domain-containing protein
VRIDAKKLRYLAEFVSGLYAERETHRYLQRLAAVQTALGSLNDVAAMKGWIRTAAATLSFKDRTIVTEACNRFAAARITALTVELDAAWRRFRKTAPFWG